MRGDFLFEFRELVFVAWSGSVCSDPPLFGAEVFKGSQMAEEIANCLLTSRRRRQRAVDPVANMFQALYVAVVGEGAPSVEDRDRRGDKSSDGEDKRPLIFGDPTPARNEFDLLYGEW